MSRRHNPLDLSNETLVELLEGLIRYEDREMQKLRARRSANTELAQKGEAGIALGNAAMLSSTNVRSASILVEKAAGVQFANQLHRQPLLRSFFNAHLPHARVATRQAVENALLKGTLKGGLLVAGLLVAPPAAVSLFVAEELIAALAEYGLVVRPTQEAQNASHMIHSRAGRLAFYRRLRNTLATNGELTAEQVRRIVERQNERLFNGR